MGAGLGPPLDVLLPMDSRTRRLDPEPGESLLTALYERPGMAPAPVWVRANMIATLDGAATGSDGRTGSINGPADHRVFQVLRSLADVVLVGAGTVRAEGYRELPVRPDLAAARAARGQAPEIQLAIVSRSGPVPDELLDAEHPPLVVTVSERPDLDALRRRIGPERVVVAGSWDVDPGACLTALAARGLSRVLTEGGGRLLGDLLAADVVDELCLTTTPELVGGSVGRVVERTAWFRPTLSAQPAHLLHSDGVLLGRWLLARGGRPTTPAPHDAG